MKLQPGMASTYGISIDLDQVRLAKYDPDRRTTRLLPLVDRSTRLPRLCVRTVGSEVDSVRWGEPPNENDLTVKWWVFHDVVRDLRSIWHLPFRSRLMQALLEMITARVEQDATLLVACSPQIPRAMRHGVLEWFGQHGYVCVPLTEPWVVLCTDHLLSVDPLVREKERVLVLLQARRRCFLATIDCCAQAHVAGSEVSSIECELAALDSLEPPPQPGTGTRAQSRHAWDAVRLLCAKRGPANRLIACCKDALQRCVDQPRPPAEHAQTPVKVHRCSPDDVAKAAARIASACADGRPDGPIVRWKHQHQIGLRLGNGAIASLVVTDLTAPRQAQCDLRWECSDEQWAVSIVDFPGGEKGAAVPVDERLIRRPPETDAGEYSLTVRVEQDGGGSVTLSDKAGEAEFRSGFTLC